MKQVHFNMTLLIGKFYIFVCTSCLFFFTSCQSDNSNLEGKNAIQEAIQKDLLTGVKSTSTLELDIPNLPTKKYMVDRDHSSISFRTGHWEIVDLIGWFSELDIVMYSDREDFTDAVIVGKVNVNSIVMPNEKMMGSVQNPPYVDTDVFPHATFLSDSFIKTDSDNYLLTGKFSLNGIEKEITFNAKFNGFAYPGEQSICGFTVTGTINRHDYNIADDGKLHSGKALHDDLIHLTLSLRLE